MTERVLGPTGSPRRRWTLLLPLVAVIALGLLYVAGAQAVHATSPLLFELEGDTTNNLTSSKLGTLRGNINASTTSIDACQTAPGTPTGVIIIDFEQMNVTANVSANFGGSCSGDKRTYTVARGFTGPLGASTAASHSGGADITLLVTGSDNGDDWSNLFPSGSSTVGSNFDGKVFVEDKIGTDGDATYFTGGGSKDREDIANWQWSVNDQSPDKNDIVNAFAAAYHIGTTHYLYFGADRYQVGGDAQMAFWFLRSPICLAGTPLPNPPGGNCPNTNPGKFVDPITGDVAHHTDGDILAVVNFDNGGTIGLAGVFEWEGGVGGAPAQKLFGTNADCTTLTNPTDEFCTVSNKGLHTWDPTSWHDKYKGKLGGSDVDYYQTSAFIEGGIDLSDFAGSCFPGFLAETRSSSGPDTGLSLDAQLKDLAFGQFQSCDATLATTPKQSDGTTTVPALGLQLGSATSGTDGQVQAKDSAAFTVSGVDEWDATLKFFLCGPISTSSTCASGGLQIGSTMTISEADSSPIASAAAIITRAANDTTGAPGRYCWRAELHFTAPAGIPDKTDSSANECFFVKPVTPSLDTDAGNGPVDFGQPVTDEATLTGTAKQPATTGSPYAAIFNVGDVFTQAAAGGTITFQLYGPFTSGAPTPTECATIGINAGFATAFPSGIQKTVTGDGTYPKTGQSTVSYTPGSPGWYFWKASYGGNDPNTLASGEHNTDCSDTDEAVQVRTIPTEIRTKQSWFPNDTANIKSSVAGDNLGAGGTVDFFLYESANCTGTLRYEERQVLTGGANDETVSTHNYTGSTAKKTDGTTDVAPYVISTAYADAANSLTSAYSWKVVYTPTDSAHTGKQSACNAASPVSIEKFQITYTNDNSGGTAP